MYALNFHKISFPFSSASFRPIYLVLPLESPINMRITYRNIIIFYSKLTCPTPNCYLNTVNKLPIQSETPSFCPPSAVRWKMRSAECGVWKVRSVESAECGKCGVWKVRSVENADGLQKQKRRTKLRSALMRGFLCYVHREIEQK